MASDEVERLKSEKLNLIEKYIKLKTKHQELFFNHQQVLGENKLLKIELTNLQKQKLDSEKNEKEQFSTQMDSVLRENQSLIAKVKQLNRISTSNRSNVIPNETDDKENSQEYEVENILKHRGRKGKREFLVRWKNFDKNHDTWEKEKNLLCPEILKKYLQTHRLA